jgi:two-component system chemotaxis sensor kinase CheA
MPALDSSQIQALFAEEAEARLAHLSQLLLQLDARGDDATLVGSIFRDIHTLKGSSAVAGLDEVSHFAHQLEELVDDLRAGNRAATPDLVDALLAGADGLAALIAKSLGRDHAGESAEETPPEVLEEVPWRDPHLSAPAGGDRARGPRWDGPGQARPVRPTVAPPRPVLAPGGGAPDLNGGAVMVPMGRIDELVRLVGQAASAHLRMGRLINDRFGVNPVSSAEFNELSRCLNDLQDRAMRTRMVPIATVTDQLHRAVRELSRSEGKDVHWEASGTDTELDRGVLHQLSDSLLHLVRNAVDHGIESAAERQAAGKAPQGTIALRARQLGSEVIIAITDDGGGIDTDRVRAQAVRLGIEADDLAPEELLQLTFRAGLSTAAFVTDISGRGVGLDVVRTNVDKAHGWVEVWSQPGVGTEFRIIVPITVAVLRCLLVEGGGQRFALPFHRVVLSRAYQPAEEPHAEGRPVVWVDDEPVPVSLLRSTLGTGHAALSEGPIVVVTDGTRRHAFLVDRLVGQRDVVLKGLTRLLPRLPAVAGASVEPDGSVLLVLDPPGLIERGRCAGPSAVGPNAVQVVAPRPRVLVVDDALTVRELQRSILARAGFEVRVATDGIHALSMLAQAPSDLVLTDVEMPNMDGFELTAAIRANPTVANLPVLILTSRDSDVDRQRGLEAGADGFIIKSRFDEAGLLAAVNRLIGEHL